MPLCNIVGVKIHTSHYLFCFFLSSITPCRAAGPHELSGDMGRIYELVVRHCIASVSHDAVWRSTKISFEIEALGPKGKFFVSGKEIVSLGFLEVLLHKQYGDDADKDEDDEEEDTADEIEEALNSDGGVTNEPNGFDTFGLLDVEFPKLLNTIMYNTTITIDIIIINVL